MALITDTKFTGTVEDIIFAAEDTGYTVMALNCGGELISCVGNMGTLYEGEKLTVSGKWSSNPNYGRQLKVEECKKEIPETAKEMLAFLSSGLIKGVREKLALKIVKKFGSDTFNVLANNPSKLALIDGISIEKAQKISKAFNKLAGEREAITGLEKYGLSSTECMKIYKALGSGCVGLVEDNPYIVCSGSIGIPFERAMFIEGKLPHTICDDYRTAAAIVAALESTLSEGHTCFPVDGIYDLVREKILVTPEDFERQVIELISQKRIVGEKMYQRDFLFLPQVYFEEKNIAKELIFHKHFIPEVNIDVEKEINRAEKIGSVVYNEKQRQAIEIVARQGILVLTGGPGTGKTTTLRGILRVLEQQGLEVALAAPTGRAAKRMSALTGREAKTIHRLLEAEFDENDKSHFKRNKKNPIKAKALIVDEVSMVDVSLFHSLISALPIGCRLVMVGDSNQLPAVGAGNVLDDIIKSRMLPVIELTQVFRQAMESLIISNAHSIVNGQMPDLTVKNKDFFFMDRINSIDAANTIVSLCAQRLPKAYNYDALQDIQVLCPSKKGNCGTGELNFLLQSALNPKDKKKPEHISANRIFRLHDKVMQTKNNYDIEWTEGKNTGRGIYNGDIGYIEKIDEVRHIMLIKFDERLAVVPFENLNDIELAYAITVHKSQGSEFNCVIIPVTGINPLLAYRNLFYTAVTRAKNMLILVGSTATVAQMVNNNRKLNRYSGLLHFLNN